MLLMKQSIPALSLAALLLCAAAPQPYAVFAKDKKQPQSSKAEPKMQTLAGTNWTLKHFVVDGVATPPINTITIKFGTDGRAGGNSGCNSYGGDFKTQPSGLSFGPLMSTKRACADDGAMRQETQFFAALESAGKYQIANDQLTIFYANGKNRLEFVRLVEKTGQ